MQDQLTHRWCGRLSPPHSSKPLGEIRIAMADREVTVIKARFRSRGYDEADRQQLRRELGALGAVRLTPEWPPEAGGSHEIWLAVEFIGTGFASGILGHLAGKFYDRLVAGLKRLFADKRQKDNAEPELVISLSYDDLDIEIAVLDESYLEKVPTLLEAIHRAVVSGPLAELAPTRVYVPMARVDSQWVEVHPVYGEDVDERHWGIVSIPDRTIGHVYDSRTERTSPLRKDRHNE